MENKINIAKLLKDCPKGMELDCTMYDKVTLLSVYIKDPVLPITVLREDGCAVTLTKYGQYTDVEFAKCVIFPKGKTTWTGFQRPFKDGDIITCTNAWCSFVAIFKKIIRDGESFERYCLLILNDNRFKASGCSSHFKNPRLATEEEIQKLFQAIKDNGYKWNEETKTLDIAPKFKVGDKIKKKCIDNIYAIEIVEVGGIIYSFKDGGFQYIETVDKEYELIPNKFDFNTLKIFESRVLVRNGKDENWRPAMFGGFQKERHAPYVTVGGVYFRYLIPYKGNEHLIGTTNDCDDFFKTWE